MNYSSYFLSRGCPESRRRSSRAGVALIIVLGCVALLSVLAFTLLSWSTVNRQISAADTAVSTSTLFGQGAISTIIGDLQQEIVAGSTVATVTANGTNIYLCQPNMLSSGQGPVVTMVPATVGFTRTWSAPGVESDGLANLLKVSVHGYPFYTNSAPYTNAAVASDYLANGRASSALTTTASLNGRKVTLARWNQHLLLKQAAALPSTNVAPVAAFPTPNWILVARDGSATYNLPSPPAPSAANAIGSLRLCDL